MLNYKQLEELLQKLQKFQVVKCGLHHEKVALDINSNPIYKQNDDAIIFSRVKLCAIKDRNIRLGCAHSISNSNFIKILDELKNIIPEKSNKIICFKNEINQAINKIYFLDHEKGQLEHNLSIAKITSDYRKQQELLKEAKVIKQEYNSQMDNLIEIKNNIQLLIENVINSKR
ncbi:hypothetical protein [Lacinutrix chionoecetis]